MIYRRYRSDLFHQNLFGPLVLLDTCLLVLFPRRRFDEAVKLSGREATEVRRRCRMERIVQPVVGVRVVGAPVNR